MDLQAAIDHLAKAGVTEDIIRCENVDPADSTGLRLLVDELLATIADRDCIADARQEVALREAREHLLTDDERALIDALAARLVIDLESYLTSPR